MLDALEAVETARIGNRTDFYWTLHAVFVKKHEHSEVFEQAFRIFWRRRGLIEKIIATLSPRSPAAPTRKDKKPEAAALRAAEALLKTGREDEGPKEEEQEISARLTVSEREILQGQGLRPDDCGGDRAGASAPSPSSSCPTTRCSTRRMVAAARAAASIRAARSAARCAPAEPPSISPTGSTRCSTRPSSRLCDISGSMADYTRLFLHFLHALTDARRRVHTFLFGTRLTNVTRSLKSRDPDEALARCSAQVQDWSGGTRIATCLHEFNRAMVPPRAGAGRGGAAVHGRAGARRCADLEREMDRLHRSCRRLVWLNPLLRFDAFEARAQGIRAMLPHVDEFRPIHNLASMETWRRRSRRTTRARPTPAMAVNAWADPLASRWSRADRSAVKLSLVRGILRTGRHAVHRQRYPQQGRGLAPRGPGRRHRRPWSRPGAPRRGPVGSHLIIDEDGNFLGSVSGGCVEGAVVTEAVDVIGDGKPRMLEFGVADETAWRVGPLLRRAHPRLCREGGLMASLDVLLAFAVATALFAYFPGAGAALHGGADDGAGAHGRASWRRSASISAATPMCWRRRFGLSAVFQHVPELYAAVKLAGAAYLVWLGIGMIRNRGFGGGPAAPCAKRACGGRSPRASSSSS